MLLAVRRRRRRRRRKGGTTGKEVGRRGRALPPGAPAFCRGSAAGRSDESSL
jgi:hypothetical protein